MDDGQVEGGAAAAGELELDVVVEEVQQGRGRDAEGEAEEVAAGVGGRAASLGLGRRRRRARLLAQDADLLDALGGDELGEAVSELALVFLYMHINRGMARLTYTRAETCCRGSPPEHGTSRRAV